MKTGTVLSSPPSDMGASILGPLFTPLRPIGIALRQEQSSQGDGRLRNNLPRRRQGERKKKRTLVDTLDWRFFSARPAAHQSSNLSHLFFPRGTCVRKFWLERMRGLPGCSIKRGVHFQVSKGDPLFKTPEQIGAAAASVWYWKRAFSKHHYVHHRKPRPHLGWLLASEP